MTVEYRTTGLRNRSSVTAAGRAKIFVSDAYGRMVETTDRAERVVARYYDALNHLDSLTADGQTTTYRTDPRGRFLATSNAASADTVFFDGAGRPDTVVAVRGTQRYVRVSRYDSTTGQRTQLAISMCKYTQTPAGCEPPIPARGDQVVAGAPPDWGGGRSGASGRGPRSAPSSRSR